MDDLSSLYLRRKLGQGMGKGYVLSSLSPALLLFLITAVMVFALTFICSVSGTIDRMLEVLGSGSVLCYEEPDLSLLPSGAEVSRTASGEGLAYSSSGETAVLLKGTGPGYFEGLRAEELELTFLEEDVLNPVVLSSGLAGKLSLSLSDRLTLLVYDKGKDRVRPVLCTVKGIFKTVYPQLDSRLLYVPIELLGDAVSYEILLPKGGDAERLARSLPHARSYRDLYSALYSNVRSSVSMLYLVFLLVSLLAAFFSVDIAEAYAARDRKDIAHLLLLGLEERKLSSLYFRLTLSSVFLAAGGGTLLGLLLSALSPRLIEAVAGSGSAILEYYVLSFSLEVPWARIVLMALLMLLLAALAVKLKLKASRLSDLYLP